MKSRSILFSVALLSALTFLTSCSDLVKKVAMKAISESAEFEKEDTAKWGGIVEQDIELPASFTAIDAKGAVRIVFTQDSTFAVRARGNEKCLGAYRFEVRKDELKVAPKDFDGGVKKNTPAITLFISAPMLSEVEVEGVGKLELTGTISQVGPLDIDVAGAGEISIEDLTLGSLNIELNGAGKCNLDKVTAAGDIEIEINGAGDVNANVFCQELSVELNGAGNAVLSGECKNFICEENGSSKVDFTNLKR